MSKEPAALSIHRSCGRVPLPVVVTINSCKQKAACTVDDLVKREPAGKKKGIGMKAGFRDPGSHV